MSEKCPKCESESTYRFEGAYHCKRCECHFTDWQQAEISRLTAALHDAEAISRIDRSLLDAAKIYTDSLTSEVKAKDEEIATLRNQVEEAELIIESISTRIHDHAFGGYSYKELVAAIKNTIKSYRLNHPTQKGE
jgi:predicted  nucleic acid-binding Zn-ribbon protein